MTDITFSSPGELTVICFFVAATVVYLTDRFAMPAAVWRASRVQRTWLRACIEMTARLPIILFVYAFFFSISWRPIYSAVGTISYFVIFTGISRAKFIFIREPLIFSDIALVVDVFKYKTIFYATGLNTLFWIASFGYVFGVSGLFMLLEPHCLPGEARFFWICVGIAAWVTPLVLLFIRPTGAAFAHIAEYFLRTLEPRLNTARYGTFASVAYHFIIWLGRRRDAIVADITHSIHHVWHELLGDAPAAAPLIVVWQSESFLDLRNLGEPALHLPTIDQLKERAAQWGRMRSVFEGGYTLRTEFSVLSGLEPDDIHADASYPYLRAAFYKDVVWPSKLRAAGWNTHFIHPYDSTFFNRKKAMPLLGFSEMTMLEEFDHLPARDGPYVSDAKLTKKVLEIAAQSDADRPALLFVASMGNHGPWEAGRCEGMTDSVEIYKQLLRDADEALGHLVSSLDQYERPVWLVFYGDHAPLLKRYADPFPDPRTDYFIVPLATVAREGLPVIEKEEAPWNLFAALVRLSGIGGNPV
ncbi:LTA synthase family protein [Agrobacterium tumefaciens]|uniref:Capsular biosynthesis protein n=1 Tax=Agrobacterium tumefaciens TaxID=358 RepID=A0A176XHF5_AGRTU|nr:LTA synthase family protein [Agrobacterium tumefaciens]OAE48251.1 capsular biosynthesis protein [Agrobacterium tumefaciens]